MAFAAALLHLARRSASASASSCCITKNSSFFCRSPYDYLHLLYFSTSKPAPNTSPSFPQEFFIEKYQFSTRIASKAASKNPQNANLVLSFLQNKGFSLSHLERIVRHYPRLLSLCVETNIKPKLKIFEDLGLSAGEAAQLVARDFSILKHGANRIIRSLSVLKDLLGSKDLVIKLIKRHPGLFYSNPEKTILPNIEILKSCGVQVQQINTMLFGKPSFLCISPENMRRCVQKADEMGVQRTSRMFIHAVGAVSSMSAETLEIKLKSFWDLEIKLKSFRDLGFSQDDILRVFRSHPVVITVSTLKIKEVKEVLLENGKYDMSCIIKNPKSLAYSVEKRYRPRLQVLKVLERKSLITKWPGLSTLANMTDKSFFERFVAPNINEVGEEFKAKPAASGNLLDMKSGLKAKLG